MKIEKKKQKKTNKQKTKQKTKQNKIKRSKKPPIRYIIYLYKIRKFDMNALS